MDPNSPMPSQPPEPQNPVPGPQPTVIKPSVESTPMQQPVNDTPAVPIPVTVQPVPEFKPPDHPLFNSPSPEPVQPQPPLAGPFQPLQQPPKRRRFFSKKLVIPMLALLLLAGAGAGAYFGYIAPNQPGNVWNTALSRTAKGYDKLAEYAATPRESKGVSVKGSFKSSGAAAFDGSFEGTSSDDNGDFKGSLSSTGLKIGVELKTIKSPGNSPDIYFKLNGLQGLGTLFSWVGSEFENALNGLNDKWYFVDHSLFDQFSPGTNTSTQLTTEDASSILKAVGDASKEYVFTNDSKKAAITLKEILGKDQQDGRSMFHYKAGVNKQNLKSYVDKLCSNLKESKLNKFLGENPGDALGCSGLKEDVDKLSEAKTAEVWVDGKTKLIHKIRFSFTKQSGNVGDKELRPDEVGLEEPKSTQNGYVDIYQNYSGGDIFPFGIVYQNVNEQEQIGKSTTTVGLDISIDMKTNKFTFNGKTDFDQYGDKSSTTFNMSIEPTNSDVAVEKPQNARTLIELLNDLGFSDFIGGAYNGVQSNARDTERKTDINALHGQLEAYQAQNGKYPTLADINNSSWRQENMKGLDSEALKDPEGTAATLKSSVTVHAYSYDVLPADCDNGVRGDCTNYTLTATLEEGGTYVKQSLN